jgi:hypothetical protein
MTNWIERAQSVIRKTTAPEASIGQDVPRKTTKSPAPELPILPKSPQAFCGKGSRLPGSLQAERPARPPSNAIPDRVPELAPSTSPAMPKGVRLIRWELKQTPVAIDVCSVVVDIPKFIERELRALDSRLNNPWTIHGGFTVPQMLDRLAQAGLEVELEPKGGANE